MAASREYAEKVREVLAKLPALRDLQFGQSLDYPTIDVGFNRERGGLLGVKTVDAARSLVAATSSSRFTVPNYWADPNSGVSYQLQVQIPQAKTTTLEDVKNVTVTASGGKSMLLRNVAAVTPGSAVGQYERYNMARVVSVTANIQTDLGSVMRELAKIEEITSNKTWPAKPRVDVRGQTVPMQQLLDGF